MEVFVALDYLRLVFFVGRIAHSKRSLRAVQASKLLGGADLSHAVVPVAAVDSVVLLAFSLLFCSLDSLFFSLALVGLRPVQLHLHVGYAVVVWFHFAVVTEFSRLF